MAKHIYWFQELDKTSLAVAGGKGANLAEMTNAGFPIPEGFMVSSEAYFEFVRGVGIDNVIREHCGSLDVQDTLALNAASEAVKTAILSAEMPSDIRADIIRAYNKLCGTDLMPAPSQEVLVAVRSSATAEDLPSIAGDEPVLVTFNGEALFLKMSELWRKYEQEPNAIIRVPCLDEKNKMIWKQASEIYAHPVKARLARITTRTGRQITITADHSLLVLDADSMRVKPASIREINEDTRVPVLKQLAMSETKLPLELDVAKELGCEVIVDGNGLRVKEGKWKVQKPFPRKIALNNEFAYFLGAYAAEGSLYKNNCIDISCESPEMTARLKPFAESLGLKVNASERNVRVFSIPLARLLQKMFGKPLPFKGKGRGARTKSVPSLIFGGSKELIAAFLRGYFDGDGYVSKNEVSVTSVSKQLRAGTSLLLSMLGIQNYLKKQTVYVRHNALQAFSEIIGCTEERKRIKLDAAIAAREKRSKENDQFNTFPASRKIAALITEEKTNSLLANAMEGVECPACKGIMKKNGLSETNKQRWMCSSCKTSVSEGIAPLKKRYYFTNSDLDASGRFLPGSAPWNKGRYQLQAYGAVALQKIAGQNASRELAELLEADVFWDRIEKIEEIDYEGLVYDFVVPGPQNFLAGTGGIITHNTASFAGQQETYLNIRGADKLVEAVRKCWASLFGARAIYYRQEQHFDHLRVGIAVVVQRMVQSKSAGVMFSIDPVTNDSSKIIIEGAFGLGEAVVSGSVTPDRYVVDKNSLTVLEKNAMRQDKMIAKVGDEDQWVDVPEADREKFKLSDREVVQLARYGKAIEEHYGFPQDMEWAVEGDKVYIVQSRAVTTIKKIEAERASEKAGKTPAAVKPVETISPDQAKVLLQGLGASPGIASGNVRIVADLKELYKVKEGDILVTAMTSPDFVPAMKRAAGIVTDEGGMTCHAAIVSRELGIPCIVGTRKATALLEDGEAITVDARHGIVYQGMVALEEAPKPAAAAPGAVSVVAAPVVTGTKIYVNVAEPELAEKVAAENVDGVGLLRAEFMIAGIGKHPKWLIKQGRQDEFVEALSRGLRKVCAAFGTRPVVYRATDFKTNEYKSLEGGAEFEPHEENPMIGYRGCFRYIKDPEVFKLELEAIKRVREQYGMRNLWLMIPVVRTLHEFKVCKELVEEAGLHRSRDFKLGIMCEVPSTVILAEEFCKAGADFFSIGSNDLTQLTLGVDRDNPVVAEDFDERDPAVLRSVKHVIESCHKHGVKVSICGQAPSVYREFAEKLVEYGIDSISVNPDVIDQTRRIVASAEQRVLLKAAREKQA
ncbi:MAG: phosphoenolpyruvate synthase [Candidatus Micrarchaeota archaeon]